MKRFSLLVVLLIVVAGGILLADTEVAPYWFTLPGDWTVMMPGDLYFADCPTLQYGIQPYSKVVRKDEKYFGYFFSYGPGEMIGSGSPMDGTFTFYPEWEEFGYRHMVEAEFRSILEKCGSDLRRQFFWEVPGWEELMGSFNAFGYADVWNNRYGFVAISIIPDVAAHITGIIYCAAEDLDANLREMKEILGMEVEEEYEEW